VLELPRPPSLGPFRRPLVRFPADSFRRVVKLSLPPSSSRFPAGAFFFSAVLGDSCLFSWCHARARGARAPRGHWLRGRDFFRQVELHFGPLDEWWTVSHAFQRLAGCRRIIHYDPRALPSRLPRAASDVLVREVRSAASLYLSFWSCSSVPCRVLEASCASFPAFPSFMSRSYSFLTLSPVRPVPGE